MLGAVSDAPAPSDPDARWWGWGGPEPAGAAAVLEELCAMLGQPPPPRAALPLGLVEPPDSQLSAADLAALGALLELDDSPEARVRCMAGSAYPDLVRRRRGQAAPAPDAVVRPHDARSLAGLLRAAVIQHLALVPRGGGTSVVGGVDASGT